MGINLKSSKYPKSYSPLVGKEECLVNEAFNDYISFNNPLIEGNKQSQFIKSMKYSAWEYFSQEKIETKSSFCLHQNDIESIYRNHAIAILGHKKSNLEDILAEVKRSEYMLEFEDNWDEEGSISYSRDTWTAATRFVVKLYNWAKTSHNTQIPAPKIYHGPDGSIDILWKNTRARLLVNIPPNTDIATYYGDDYETKRIVIVDEFNFLDFSEDDFNLYSIVVLLKKYFNRSNVFRRKNRR